MAAAGPEKFSPEFIQKQVEEFNIGKRHLANMMGEDPENFTQEDVDVRDRELLPLRVDSVRSSSLRRREK